VQANHAHREPRRYTTSTDIAHACMWWPWLFYQACAVATVTLQAVRHALAPASEGKPLFIHRSRGCHGLCQLSSSQLLGFQQTPNLDAINTIWLGKAATNPIPRQSQQYCIHGIAAMAEFVSAERSPTDGMTVGAEAEQQDLMYHGNGPVPRSSLSCDAAAWIDTTCMLSFRSYDIFRRKADERERGCIFVDVRRSSGCLLTDLVVICRADEVGKRPRYARCCLIS